MQFLQLPQLFLRQRSLRNGAEIGEEVGHEARFAGKPFALERALQRGQRRLGMWARLVLQLRRPPFDQAFEQIESAAIDGRAGALADLDEIGAEFIDRGLVADLGEERMHTAEEGIDLLRRVSDNSIGQSGQQTEIVRRLVELLEQPQMVLRRTGFFQ